MGVSVSEIECVFLSKCELSVIGCVCLCDKYHVNTTTAPQNHTQTTINPYLCTYSYHTIPSHMMPVNSYFPPILYGCGYLRKFIYTCGEMWRNVCVKSGLAHHLSNVSHIIFHFQGTMEIDDLFTAHKLVWFFKNVCSPADRILWGSLQKQLIKVAPSLKSLILSLISVLR